MVCLITVARKVDTFEPGPISLDRSDHSLLRCSTHAVHRNWAELHAGYIIPIAPKPLNIGLALFIAIQSGARAIQLAQTGTKYAS